MDNNPKAPAIFGALFAAILFGIGLEVSQMTNPQKVIGFLDLFGNWDPSLAFVMGGAVIVNTILYRWTLKRDKPILVSKFMLPSRSDIDKPLVLGSALFGIGWGMTGFCPGPAIAGSFRGQVELLIVAASIIVGMIAYSFVKKN